ncbi:hypothetical protein CLAFUW4_12552 [Fulvia fulva]|uniref:PNPLA domain-containing protein n=1 Tax=Passalora fulva TaxID=5499 RepID=A0A9Q8PDL5_PASFU|nr:uncharacterized protein CLAFUR5_11577 [Fulvia fulva]KAK4618340.1 hypothetical protein CLAFUR4_12557 [Fulvia fulva]KAK4618500.1 hypothetical protein CLAFUR0_12568 [Fulvia fulva]UJO20509.1 hypothetical protein CLAFUR5_11577 [Fulvia fulva]WPV18076.1 hypothetical protein CLAFUW4_12552 [Fulvia fulva]WPV32941.1 hypothetical protein CLAFUW7_12559 [Fulvia fulva]
MAQTTMQALKPSMDDGQAISTSSTHVAESTHTADYVSPAWGRRFNSDTHANSPWARKVILSLDGGGVRGYASLLILRELMRRLEVLERQESKDESQQSNSDYLWNSGSEDGHTQDGAREFRPHHYFDYCVGTSNGGLSAIMLGRLQMTVDKAIEQYDIVGTQVFGHPRKFALMGLGRTRYGADNMNAALQNAMLEGVAAEVERSEHRKTMYPRVGARILDRKRLTEDERIQIKQLKTSARQCRLRNENLDAARTIVVSHGGNMKREAYLFRSYDHPAPSASDGDRVLHLNHGPASEAAIWEAARATSAAPGYFFMLEIAEGRFEDGGLGENNPVSLAYEEVKQMHLRREPLLILSIGTGLEPDRTWEKDIPFRPLKQAVRMWRDLEQLQNQITDSEKTHQRFRGRVNDSNRKNKDPQSRERNHIHYHRFNVPDISNIRLDEWQPPATGQTTKQNMETAVAAYLAQDSTSRDLDACAQILFQTRCARAQTERWERFALHLTYCCREKDCEAVTFTSRKSLRKHAIDYHGFVWRI